MRDERRGTRDEGSRPLSLRERIGVRGTCGRANFGSLRGEKKRVAHCGPSPFNLAARHSDDMYSIGTGMVISLSLPLTPTLSRRERGQLPDSPFLRPSSLIPYPLPPSAFRNRRRSLSPILPVAGADLVDGRHQFPVDPAADASAKALDPSDSRRRWAARSCPGSRRPKCREPMTPVLPSSRTSGPRTPSQVFDSQPPAGRQPGRGDHQPLALPHHGKLHGRPGPPPGVERLRVVGQIAAKGDTLSRIARERRSAVRGGPWDDRRERRVRQAPQRSRIKSR